MIPNIAGRLKRIIIIMSNHELKWIITNDFGGGDSVAIEVKLEDMPYTAYIKWDGCCEITQVDACKGPDGLENDSFHICDIPRFIRVLQSLEDFRMDNINGAE